MEQVIRIEPVPAVLKKHPNAKLTYLLCDSAGFADTADQYGKETGSWGGNMMKNESVRCMREGDLSAVAPSDDFLSKLEDQVFVSKGWTNVFDVVGALPNVPAFIAGVPECMRRRQRTTSQSSPLAICVDLTSSGGIDARDVKKRGIAILALVRLLSNLRPIELYANVALGNGNAFEIVCKIETAPLDLARAAHILTNPTVSRGLGYGVLQHRFGSGGGWPFNSIDTHRATARESLLRILPVSDLLYMPPICLLDDNVNNPIKWIKAMLKQYGGPSVIQE